MADRRVTDHARARKFAVEWALKSSDGEIANLARAYLDAKHELDRPLRELSEKLAMSAAKLEREPDAKREPPNFGLEYVRRDAAGNELERISPDVPRAVAAFARWTGGVRV